MPAGEVKDAPGMSLRDYLAAKVMPAVVATLEGNPISEEQMNAAIQMMAAMSYRIADAMLEARKAAA